MTFLLDTCVISEFTRRKPEEKVIRWLDRADEDQIFLSVITIGEIQHGIERLPESLRKTELQGWMKQGLVEHFGKRVLTLESQTMVLWGSLVARMEGSGQPMAVMDSLIAATAFQHNCILITRNISDFSSCGVQLINPWE